MPSVIGSASRSPVDGSGMKRKRASGSSSGSESDASSRSSRSRSSQRRRRRPRASSFDDEDERKAVVLAKAKRSANDDEDRVRLEAKGEGIRLQQAKLSNTRAGGTYIPPARLRAMMAEAAAADAGSVEFQRMSWDALKKSITGLVNKVAAENIKFIVPELFGGANLIRGRGLFCRSIMKAQSQSLPFTPVFASLAAVVNTKLPMVGELLVTRLVNQFRRSFKRNDKVVCHATAIFLAHLVNQRVVQEILALELLVLLLEQPTDDSVEIAVAFMREAGAFLAEEAPKANNSIFDRFRAVLYEGNISKRVQYMIEVLSQVRRDRYKDNPKVAAQLDLVEEDDQITHQIGLDDKLNIEETLNVFRADPDFVENEEKYREIKNEILGEGDSDGDDESGSDDADDSDADSSDAADDEVAAQERVEIQDRTETNMINLRRTIYLTIMSSAAFEEAVHKLMKLNIPEGQEIELANMVIECCSQERTFSKFYGLIGERLCKLKRTWSECYETCFRNYYDSIHRYETNRLRNIARFFGWILAADGVSWACFSAVHMTEEDTTSSSRIFIKILMGEMKERLGMKALVSRFAEPTMQEYYVNMMPRNDPKATRFSINFFTSIGVPQLTDGMRDHLKVVREEALAKAQLQDDDSSSSESDSTLSSSSISGSSSYSGSYDSRSPPRRRRYDSRSRSRTPPSRRRRYDSRSRSLSPTPPPRRRHSYSRSISPRSPRRPSRRDDSRSLSSLSPRRPKGRADSRSLSPLSPRRPRGRADSRSLSPLSPRRPRVRADSRSPSPTPPRRPRRRSDSRSLSPTPPPRRRARSPTYSRSPPRPERR